MYGKYIGSLFMEDFTVLQKEEIRQGLDEGLDQEVIYLFARPYYNFLQMKLEMKMKMHNLDYGVTIMDKQHMI